MTFAISRDSITNLITQAVDTNNSETPGMTSFTAAGDSGGSQKISDGDTLNILGGTGLSSAASDTDTVTLNLENTTVAAGDYNSANITVDAQGRITEAKAGAQGTMSSFNATGDSGSQTISNGETLNIAGGTGLTSVAAATDTVTLNLDNTAVTAGDYNSANITVDAQGRITAAAAGAQGTMSSFNATGDSGSQTISNGETLNIAGGTGLTSVAAATDTVTLNLDNTTVTAGDYTSADITVNAQGQITAAGNGGMATASAGQILIGRSPGPATLGSLISGTGAPTATNDAKTIEIAASTNDLSFKVIVQTTSDTSKMDALYWSDTYGFRYKP